jgi:hypothetical protein
MSRFKLTGLVVLAFVTAGIFTGLDAETTTKQSAKSSDDLAEAQQALQKILEQGPPVTAPTLPRGTTNQSTSKIQSPPQVLSPAGGTPAKTISGQKLLPEGHYIADRRGRLVKGEAYWTFVFESDGKAMADPPVKILPNRWLEKMESDVTASHQAIVFQISGEVTTYHGENYLLLRKVLIERETSKNFK